ncbi:S1C family serine protease [Amycolatopsis minnesotensis]|uniref:PDZ domain-containing protein n=1 Tax=Amycolatopsis minnesotensis TaxID=337894 RepID=A0ABN2RN49_9PSEU
MTENDAGAQPGGGDAASTPPSGIPAGAEQAPSPWSAQAQQAQQAQPQHGTEGVLYGTAAQQQPQPHQHQPHIPYAAAPYATHVGMQQPQQQQRPPSRGAGKIVAGAAVVALVVGGAAGGIGGYLVGNNAGGGSSVTALDQQPPAKQTAASPPGSVEAVAQKVLPSVVQLQTEQAEGSGFVLSDDGYILTNNHVVDSAANGGALQVSFQDGKKVPGKVIGRDPTTDIAVVKANGVAALPAVELGRSDDLKIGQTVVAVGSPFELAGTVTSGIVSSLHRPVSAGGEGGNEQSTVLDAVQTDAAINPGNSGGPLANMSGQIIGINSVIYSPPQASGGGGQRSEPGNVGIGFAIPIDQARRTANDIIKTGKATQTFIGAQVGNAPQGGAKLGAITPGSPAEKAGLKEGDVVTKLDDRAVDKADTLVAAVRTSAPGEKVKMTLSDSRVVEVTLGGQPVEAK